MRALGLDVGERRIGVALSDPLGISAQRLATIGHRGLAQDVATVAQLVVEHQVGVVVVGLPLTMAGDRGSQAEHVMAFVNALRGALSCPVETVDERLTTVQGQRALLETDTSRRKRRQLIDQVAAQLILQAYLDAHATP